MPGLDRLHPHLRHAIIHDLGWRQLRPVQEDTIEAVLDGANAVVLAPTAGGKTEASIFPVLSRILTEGLQPVSALYLCPIRALLNNQEERIGRYARMVGLDAFKWHGEVGDSRKARFRREPAHLLLTTPESLEVMFISARTDARALFAGLSMVIIDEVHAFAGDDRGAHLAALLERLTQICGRDIQRIGLSATVGNPAVIGAWMQGSSERPFRLVDPARGPAARDLHIDFCASLDDTSREILRRGKGKKSLVFVESRARAERVAQTLAGGGVEVFIHHSAVSTADRALAEEQFARGQNTAIVATSTLELGIDVGDLDQVIQVDAPSTVASFLQRVGRTGRRDGTRSTGTFLCLTPETLLQAAAIVRLAEAGQVEDLRPASHAVHILAHQILALTLQEGGLSRHHVLDWIGAAFPFAGIRARRLHELIDTMVSREILYEADGLLSLGTKGEKLYGRRHFFDLYAVFSSPPTLRVVVGKEEIGAVQASFVQSHDDREGPLCFRLAGRAWKVGEVEWDKGLLHVHPADRGQVPTWLGLPGALPFGLCQTMMAVLVAPGVEAARLSRSAALELDALREGYAELLEPGTAPLEDQGDQVQWHTFAGGATNRLLAAALSERTGKRWSAGNLSVKAKDVPMTAAREAVRQLGTCDWEALATATAHRMARGLVSKFQPCLPPDAEDRLLAEKLLDVDQTVRFLASVRVGGERIGVGGRRLRDDGVAAPAVIVLPVSVETPTAGAYTPRNPVRFIATDADLDAWCRALPRTGFIGLDVETTTDFQTLCLIQLATPEENVIIDPLAGIDLTPLAELLADPGVTKVIHNASFERRVLGRLGYIIEPVLDTLTVSRAKHGRAPGVKHDLGTVCMRELEITLDKGEQRSDWARRPLTERQVRYAAVDAEVLVGLGGHMR